MLGNPLSKKRQPKTMPQILKIKDYSQYIVDYQGQQSLFVCLEDAERYAKSLVPEFKKGEIKTIPVGPSKNH